jgi:hypothetical protein
MVLKSGWNSSAVGDILMVVEWSVDEVTLNVGRKKTLFPGNGKMNVSSAMVFECVYLVLVARRTP